MDPPPQKPALTCSPLLRGDGPETTLNSGERRPIVATCSPLLRGDGPETRCASRAEHDLSSCSPLLRGDGPETFVIRNCVCQNTSCSPLLRGDGPETPHRGPVTAQVVRTCTPLLRADGPETAGDSGDQVLCGILQSPPTGRWP